MRIPLEKFKSLVYNFSKEINNMPFSFESHMQIEKIYEREIKPQLFEIQKEISNNKIINHFFKNFMESVTKYSIFLGVASVYDLQNMLLGAGGLTILETVIKANNARIEKQNEIENNALYFYHQMSKL